MLAVPLQNLQEGGKKNLLMPSITSETWILCVTHEGCGQGHV